jgi:predicted permease
MSWMRRLVNVFRSDRLAGDLDRELEFHVAERVDDLRAAGMDEASAQREARRRLGNDVLQKERARDADMLVWLDTVVADLRYALRALRAGPGFAAVAILSLALGIGANTAIFSLLDAVVLKSLPVRAPDELVQVTLEGDRRSFTNPLWEALRDREQMFSGLAAHSSRSLDLADGGEARPVMASLVSGTFFPMLGVQPAAGRLLAQGDDYRGCPAVTVLGAGFWRGEYGASPATVGSTLTMNGKPFEIVGVVDPAFFGVDVGRTVQVYVPLCAEAVITGPRSALDARSTWFIQVLGRLAPGESESAAQAELAALAPSVYRAAVPTDWPTERQEEFLSGTFQIAPAPTGVSSLRDQYSRALIVLMGLVAVVLLIACANVANLLLARAAARQREIAVRVAIGAGRRRIIRQLLTESLLLALISSVLGVAIAWWASRALVSLLSTSGRAVSLHLPLDPRVLGFTVATAIGAAVLFGLAPAWRAGRTDPQSALRAGARGIVAGHSRVNAGKLLVVGQIGLSLALVVAAGLLLGTFRSLWIMDSGFDRSDILLATVDLPDEEDTVERQRIVYGEMIEQLRTIPGVSAASASQITPVGRMTWNDALLVDGFTPSSVQDGIALMNEVMDGFFETLGTRILAGRGFDERDVRGSPRVAIVNQKLANHFFGTTDVIGREFRIANESSPFYQVIGVVENAKYESLREEPQPIAYLPWSQSEERAFSMTFALRGPAGTAALADAVEEIARRADPSMSLTFNTLQRQIADSLTRERVLALLSAFFGALALLLAMIGLYGTMAYNVARRRNEIGIRMALGSVRSRVLRMVLGEASWLIGIGLSFGAVLAYAGTRLVASFLYGLSPHDATTFVASAVLLGCAGLAACALPAWRASRVEPMSALREE